TVPSVRPPATVAEPKRSPRPTRASEPKATPPARVLGGAPPPHPAAPETGKGTLVLASSPWCRVAIDGVDRGPTPLRLELPAGAHVVELTNAEFHVARRITVTIHARETVRKSLDFGE
ncbi:MAG: PEGA domain-containing protein, partial [Polyangia bacterium]